MQNRLVPVEQRSSNASIFPIDFDRIFVQFSVFWGVRSRVAVGSSSKSLLGPKIRGGLANLAFFWAPLLEPKTAGASVCCAFLPVQKWSQQKKCHCRPHFSRIPRFFRFLPRFGTPGGGLGGVRASIFVRFPINMVALHVCFFTKGLKHKDCLPHVWGSICV